MRINDLHQMRKLALVITEKCPLACSYCHRHQPKPPSGEMSMATLKAAVGSLLSQAPAGATLEMHYLQAEPLTRPGFVAESAAWFRAWCSQRGNSAAFGLATNGVLVTDDVARLIASIPGMFIGVSLNGRRDIHNAERCGSYDAAIAAVERFRKAGVPADRLGFGAVVPPSADDTLERVAHLVQFYDSGEVGAVFLSAQYDVGEQADPAKDLAPVDRSVSGWLVDRLRRGLRTPLMAFGRLIRIVAEEHYVPWCSAGLVNVTVNGRGGIYGCIERDAGWLGNIFNGGLDLERRAAWRRASSRHRVECRGCEIRLYCGGWCRTEALAATGRYDRPARLECARRKAGVAEARWVLEHVERESLSLLE